VALRFFADHGANVFDCSATRSARPRNRFQPPHNSLILRPRVRDKSTIQKHMFLVRLPRETS
jgi:hypothetical protein